MARWIPRDASLSFTTQSDYTTAGTSGFLPLLVDADVSVSPARDVQRVQLLEGQVGVKSAPYVGSKHGGTISFKCPLRSLKSGYAPATDVPTSAGVCSPEFLLLARALGSGTANAVAAQLYKAAGIGTGSAPDSVVTAASTTLTTGALLVAATDANSAPSQMGWIKSKTGTPETGTLFEAWSDAAGNAAQAANGDNIYPSAVAYISNVQPVPMTFRYVGAQAAFGMVLTGCICEKVTLDLAARRVPMVEFQFSYTSHSIDTSIGGLVVPAAFTRLNPILGSNSGRLTFGQTSTGGGLFQTGSSLWPMADLKIEITFEIQYVDAPGGAQGVSDAIVVGRDLKVTASVPYDSADTITSGSSPWEYYLETGTSACLTLSVGRRVGSIASFFLPALRFTSQPKLENRGGFLAWGLEMEPAAYTGDGTAGTVDTGPADSPFRIGLA